MLTIGEFKPLILSKSVARTELPDTQELCLRIYTALKRVAFDTVPLRLSQYVKMGEPITFSVFRKVDANMYIRTPENPIVEADVLDIDEELATAVALLIMADLERAYGKIHMGKYYTEIENNNERLIETTLDESSNECTERFRVFP